MAERRTEEGNGEIRAWARGHGEWVLSAKHTKRWSKPSSSLGMEFDFTVFMLFFKKNILHERISRVLCNAHK